MFTEVKYTHWLATDIVNMATLFPSRLSIGIFMLVEAGLVTSFNIFDLIIFYTKGVVARLTHNWRVDYRDGLGKLHLVPELIVQIYWRQEQILNKEI